MSLCQNILEIIRQKAEERACIRVKIIVLEMGQLIGIDKNALLFCFNVMTEGTIAANAELEIITIEGEAQCQSCQKKVPLRHYYDDCPSCGSHTLTVTQGEEMRVKSMVAE